MLPRAERCGKDQKEASEYSKLSRFDNKGNCQQQQSCNVISFSFTITEIIKCL